MAACCESRSLRCDGRQPSGALDVVAQPASRPRGGAAPEAALIVVAGPLPVRIDSLAAADGATQLWRAHRVGEARAVVLLSGARAAPGGWADRLRALVGDAPRIRAAGCAAFDEAGMLGGVPALGRRWLAGHGAAVFLRARERSNAPSPLLILLGLVDVALAIERLHASGLRHGGLGAASVVLGPDGRLALVDVGLAPALAGRACSEAEDLKALGRLAMLLLTGAVPEPDARGRFPSDLRLPSRLDRRIPAQADNLLLRALQAGGPRGLASAPEMVAGLRQILRAAGAAVSPADVAQWAERHASAPAPVDPAVRRPISAGAEIAWEPLAERGPSIEDTRVDPPREEATASTLVAAAPEAPPAEARRTEVSSAPVPPRRTLGLAAGVLLAAGGVVFATTLAQRPGPRAAAGLPAASRALPGPRPEAKPPPLPVYRPPPLPIYAPRPEPSGPPPHERRAPPARFGHGAFLTLEANRVARVILDGRDTQRLTPLARFPVAPGRHRVRLVAALGDGSQDFDVEVARGATAYRYGNLDE